MNAKKTTPPKATAARKSAQSSVKPAAKAKPPAKGRTGALKQVKAVVKASKPAPPASKKAQKRTKPVVAGGSDSGARAAHAKARGGDGATASSPETRPRSSHGRRIGRPKTRIEGLKAVPTRCPTQIYTYLKGITPFLYSSLTAMFEDMMRRFLAERPWEHGLHWRKPKTAVTLAGGVTGRTGWEQVNMQLPADVAAEVEAAAATCGVSRAAFCYTSIFWWVQYIYPPAKMLGAPPAHA
ncbi:hypothetical protein [Paraburkholderia humisilvae]|uniref:Uncharacterized protein n=1 Tax=Paraburkholderia humisilvae TaxID=627669 RepID=A0A6J5DQF6_9BURK|nr:hypothetical protein [Paraburkholderia humisilvae]CAB3755817.1 hypothetical protein LMG29542_02703 [Paraburkholderia humisilvae]